ncbi:uroporphyrinogen-III C-methyltransferase [Corynebacterium sp. 153RC1]|uniref:uroporphyrinogen-III C-methyltransferase n=1 Tax=unclassified Corynebacterium TaxID=2624378 RepID=UPI00211C7E8C|nr:MULTISPECIES: uroporphyrinogen-III C-methyltransferase [unclassified Corynebacterium]MCQ9371006.1 uroporphyrinogen-III C-methyltransferase [Corynebacterium sp. 35RC1]MCQ9351609.1 uroporphyrinogen-III C-methyltransferase [Corynebacterium sp. 209RC1]MCQ9353978.1 uroporphyrinogen-III C-methyltransferase [Corynebacterium sp. 1222RC1]MCQ9355892.1 uroporphyrinogen-III C-methyltransferase [Corynebacterium sp. 122RC1]MCQ9358136.1 uroporphyrinogen-III C-methyltransferase [Corynebacterium sp. 142RC1]
MSSHEPSNQYPLQSHAHPVALIGGGPGAWDLITVRGMHRLQEAEVILCDHLGPTVELDKLCDTSNKELIDVSKLPYGKQVAQEKINELLIEHALAGKKVARLKGGDPYVFGRGFEELQALAKRGIACEVIPGVTSAISVPALAGIPITQRGVVHSFTVISGHVPPGHPSSLNDFRALAHTGGTLAVIMGVKNAPHITQALMDAGMDPNTPAVVIQEGSTEQQRSYHCTLGTLAHSMSEHDVHPPAVYVIGEVAGLGT